MRYLTTKPPQLPVMVDLATMSTPRESAIIARTGEIQPGIIEEAMEAGIRAIPIVDDTDHCNGTITVQKLAKLVADRKPLSTDDATSPCDRFPHLVPVAALIQALADHGIVLHAPDPDDDELDESWFGIITTADINRPIFRAHIYRLIAILEGWLGQLIMDEFGDDWGAIRLLSNGTQKRIREFYEEEKAEGVELSPVTNATLSDLFHIATESNNVWSLMGYDSPEQLKPVAHAINELRNHVMHPVRPLVVNDAELQELLGAVHLADDLTTRLAKRIGFVTS